MAIVDAGLNFGGGLLGRYGINSNTSGGGFLKCTYKKTKKTSADESSPDTKSAVDKALLAAEARQAQIDQMMKKKHQRGSAPGKASKKEYGQSLPKETSHNNEVMAPYRELATS